MGILCTFQLISGLKINFSKSQLCGIGIHEDIVLSYAEILGCKVVSLPFKYLGLPLGANPRRIDTWKPVIEKFEKKLAFYNRKYSRWKTNSDQFQLGKSTFVLHVSIQNAHYSCKKIRKDSEAVSLG